MEAQTLTIAQELQRAYDFFNRELFSDQLPTCVLTFRESPGSAGYFSTKRFAAQGSVRSDEIALNSSLFATLGDEEVLAVLVHEMVHLWQFHFGKPGRGKYHNVEWAEKMLSIGLHPTSDLSLSGRQTGDHVTHIILPDGLFKSVAARLIGTGFRITWYDYYARPAIVPTRFVYDPDYRAKVLRAQGAVDAGAAPKDAGLRRVFPEPERAEEDGRSFEPRPVRVPTRHRFSCPRCGCLAWGSKNLELICGKCSEHLVDETRGLISL